MGSKPFTINIINMKCVETLSKIMINKMDEELMLV